jgi:hypothetical protein
MAIVSKRLEQIKSTKEREISSGPLEPCRFKEQTIDDPSFTRTALYRQR